MKTFLYSLILVFSLADSHAQNKLPDSLCAGIKYDTIELKLLVEISASQHYYSYLDFVSQPNNLFVVHNKQINFEKVYQSDTIILKFWPAGIKYFRDQSKCLDLNSLTDLDAMINVTVMSRRQKRKFLRSLVKDKSGVKYLKATAKIVVINSGEHRWLIPKIYSHTETKIYPPYTEKIFKNSLILVSVLKFNYWK